MAPLTAARLRLTLLILATVQFTHVMDFMIMMPLGPQLMRALDIGPDRFSHLVAAYGFSAGVCGLLASLVLDRFDRKKALLLLFAGFAVATAACGLATNYAWLLGARVLAGAFGGVAGSVVTAMVGDVVPPERRGAGMAFVMSGFSLAQILGVPAGLWLAAHADWHMPFLVLAGLAALVNLVALRALPRADAHLAHRGAQSDWRRVLETAMNPNHQRAFAVVMLLTMSGMIIVPFLATVVVRNGGVSEQALVLVYMLGGGATLVSNNVLGRLGDRFGHVRVFDGVAVYAVIPVLLVAHLGHWSLPVILIVTTAFIISLGGRWTPAMTLVTLSVENRLRGGFMSLSSASQAAFGAIASTLSGWIVREGAGGRIEHYNWVGYASLVFIGLAALVIRHIRIVQPAAPAAIRPPEPESGALD